MPNWARHSAVIRATILIPMGACEFCDTRAQVLTLSL